MFCTKCGKTLPEAAGRTVAFCPYCGAQVKPKTAGDPFETTDSRNEAAKIRKKTAEAASAAAGETAAGTFAAGAAGLTGAGEAAAATAGAATAATAGNGVMIKVIAAVLAAVLAGGGGFAAYKVISERQNNIEASEELEEESEEEEENSEDPDEDDREASEEEEDAAEKKAAEDRQKNAKKTEEDTEEETEADTSLLEEQHQAYECFLGLEGSGDLKAVVDEGVAIGYYDELDMAYVGKSLTLDDFFDVLESNIYHPGNNDPGIDYAYISRGEEIPQELLAVKFTNLGIDYADDDSATVIIFCYQDGELHAASSYTTWDRNQMILTDSGYIYWVNHFFRGIDTTTL